MTTLYGQNSPFTDPPCLPFLYNGKIKEKQTKLPIQNHSRNGHYALTLTLTKKKNSNDKLDSIVIILYLIKWE